MSYFFNLFTFSLTFYIAGHYNEALQFVNSLMDATSDRLCARAGDASSVTSALYSEYEEWQKIWVK